jgi:broad specificity phosphatase PhoE
MNYPTQTMKKITRNKLRPFAGALIIGALMQAACSRAEPQTPTVVLVVRHAEKAAVEGADPPISEQGKARAQTLARIAKDAGVNAIYCTQFRRTRETAEPLAVNSGVQINTMQVNRDDTGAYVEQLADDIIDKHRGQTILVVSHSNTVPQIVERLSGTPVPAIKDDEYNNLFIVVMPAESAAKTIKLNYGA